MTNLSPSHHALTAIDAAIDSQPPNSVIRRQMLKLRTAWAKLAGAKSRVGAKPLGDEVRAKVAALLADGRDVKDVAAEAGCSVVSVYRIRKGNA